MHSFSTTRLLLRTISAKDQALFVHFYTDQEMMRYIGPTLSIEQARQSFNRALKWQPLDHPRFQYWVITDKSSKQQLGLLGLARRHSGSQTDQPAELGIMLKPSARGKKIPEEALGALAEYLFIHQAEPAIMIAYSSNNKSMNRVAQHYAFKAMEKGNQNSGMLQKSLSRSAWQWQLISPVNETN